jgi:lipoprotein-releasing system ATP-binding protein
METAGTVRTEGGESPPPPLESRRLRKSFPSVHGDELHVLEGVDLCVAPGETVAVIGASGAGKSTLLHLLGALDRPSSGEVLLGGRPVSGLSHEALAALRNRSIGFVFQFHHLLREFTALENVMMPRLIGGAELAEAEARARTLLVSVGLGERLTHKPAQLSGGEQQRVAVARALANEPLVLLADEPSGNLDDHTSERLHEVLFEIRDERRVSMVLVTHDMALAERADRILLLEEGVLRTT